jgi:hypothetical protein
MSTLRTTNIYSVAQQTSDRSRTNSIMSSFQPTKYEFQKEELFSVPTTRTYPPVIAVSSTSFWMGLKSNSQITSSKSSSILATTSSPRAKRTRVMRRPVEVIGGTLQPEQCRGPPFFRAWTSHTSRRTEPHYVYCVVNSSNEGAGGRPR